jgi:hypothetical protein
MDWGGLGPETGGDQQGKYSDGHGTHCSRSGGNRTPMATIYRRIPVREVENPIFLRSNFPGPNDRVSLYYPVGIGNFCRKNAFLEVKMPFGS